MSAQWNKGLISKTASPTQMPATLTAEGAQMLQLLNEV